VIIAGAAQQNREGQRSRVLHPKYACRDDGSERNYMRSLGRSRDARYCGLEFKIRRDGDNNYPRYEQHRDNFEPAIHGEPPG
jgi:hypothetical protein